MTQPSPWTAPAHRLHSSAPLVPGVRREVDAWRSAGWPGASPTTRRLLEHWFLDEHESAPGVPFRWYFAQREAVETLVYLHEVVGVRRTAELVTRFADTPLPAAGPPYPRFVVKMATGSGKTKVMSLALTWAYFHALREPGSTLSSSSLVIAPNLIVMERLREDFEHARIWTTDPSVPPEWRVDFDLAVCLKDDPVPTSAPGVLALTNVQALYDRTPAPPSNPVQALLGPRPPARLDASPPLLRRVAARGRLVVVNDEAHHLHDEVKADTGEPLKGWTTIHRLHELTGQGVVAQLDFSATPKDSGGRLFVETVVDYPLASAITDGIVKRPVIGELSGAPPERASDDAAVRYRTRLVAGVEKWREFRDRIAPTGARPLLFVMAEDTKAADQITDWLETLHDLTGRVLTIHTNRSGEITKSDLEVARRAAREVDRADSPYGAIVSVLMLREGWDVRNVSVIVPLRALTSKNRILPEQALGRGLRRMTAPGSGVDERVVVVEHEAFRALWDTALSDPEYDGVERESLLDVAPPATVVAVGPERMAYDIAIPVLSRALVRSPSGLVGLAVAELPARHLPLPQTLRTDTVDYTGRDLLSGEELDRARYPLEQMLDPGAVLAWFVAELSRRTRLTGQFAVLAPLVRGWVEEKGFGGPVDFDDPLVLGALAEPAAQETVLSVLASAVDAVTVQETGSEVMLTPAKEMLLSATKPYLWSGETAVAVRSVFTAQPCDSGLEVAFCGFLDRCQDVAAFAKLGREVRFSLEYRGEGGRLAYYYPDFVVRLSSGDQMVIETKGLVDLEVSRKDERARGWALDASLATGTSWSYERIDQEVFQERAAQVSTLTELVAVARGRRREATLRRLEEEVPLPPTRAEAIAQMLRLQERLSDVSGGDETLQQFRDSGGG